MVVHQFKVAFYQTASGREPVRDWLKALEKDDRNVIGKHVLMVQRGWPIGLPLCRPLGNDLWEIRSTLPSSRIARLIFSFYDGRIVLLNGFIKKTQKTPRGEINLALARLKDITT
jgi:phage-related protein